MISSFQNLQYCFLVSHDHVTHVTCDNVTLLSSLSSTLQLRKIKGKIKENKIETKSIVFNSNNSVD